MIICEWNIQPIKTTHQTWKQLSIKKSVLKCSIYINNITGCKQCAVFSTVVLVMLCTKSTQFKMLRRIYDTARKNTFVFKCNSQLHSQPSIALLLVIKTCSRHVLSERHCIQHKLFQTPTQKSPVQTMQNRS